MMQIGNTGTGLGQLAGRMGVTRFAAEHIGAGDPYYADPALVSGLLAACQRALGADARHYATECHAP